MPVAAARVKQLTPFVIHDGAAAAARGGACVHRTPNLAERGLRQFSNFSGSPPAFFWLCWR